MLFVACTEPILYIWRPHSRPKGVIEDMADCDVKRVTGSYFFRMIADQKNSPKLSSPPVSPGSLPKFSMKFFKQQLTLF